MRRLSICGARLPTLLLAMLSAMAIPGAASAATGGPVGPAVRLGAGGVASPLGTPTAAAAALADGGYVVAWNGPDALRARLLDGNGALVGGEIEVARPAGQSLDAVATLPDGFVVVWEQPSSHHTFSVLARIFDRSGAPRGRPFRVHRNSQYDRCCVRWSPRRLVVASRSPGAPLPERTVTPASPTPS